MIPGSNLLNAALSVISQQQVQYYPFASRALNAIGEYVNTYGSPMAVNGSFQPVPRSKYESYGLDFNKSYATFYVSRHAIDIQRNSSSDQIAYGGRLYQCLSDNDWFAVDGWVGVLCVDVGPSS